MLANFTRLLIAAAFALGLAHASFAQQPAPIQQVPTRLDASIGLVTSATSSATLTITPPAGQYIYLTALDVANCAGAAAVTGAAPTSITTTNFGGAAWLIGSGSSAAGQCLGSPAAGELGSPLKSAAAGTAATIVLPAFATNQTVRVSAYYYFAP